MILDKYGMIQSGGDYGDSCHRMYTCFLRTRILWDIDPDNSTMAMVMQEIQTPQNTQKLLEPEKDGVYIRNPDPTKWYSDPHNVSRDQLVPIMCFQALMSATDEFRENQKRLLLACLKRGMFSQNTEPNWVDPRTESVPKKIPDFLGPDLWAIMARSWIRTVWFPLALPIILFGDVFLVITALAKVFGPRALDSNGGIPKFEWPGPNDTDDENINNILQTTQHLFPTPFSWLARKIYKTFRQENYGNTELGEKSHALGAIAWYNHKDNPEITELARLLVERY